MGFDRRAFATDSSAVLHGALTGLPATGPHCEVAALRHFRRCKVDVVGQESYQCPHQPAEKAYAWLLNGTVVFSASHPWGRGWKRSTTVVFQPSSRKTWQDQGARTSFCPGQLRGQLPGLSIIRWKFNEVPVALLLQCQVKTHLMGKHQTSLFEDVLKSYGACSLTFPRRCDRSASIMRF